MARLGLPRCVCGAICYTFVRRIGRKFMLRCASCGRERITQSRAAWALVPKDDR